MKTVCLANAADFDSLGRWRDDSAAGRIRQQGGRFLRRLGARPAHGSSMLADVALYWSSSDCLVLAPLVVNPELAQYADHVMQRNPSELVSVGAEICLAGSAARNRSVIRRITDFLGHDSGELMVWGATEDTYELVDRVRAAGGRLVLSEAPAPGDFKSVMDLDSKVGFRQLMERRDGSSPKVCVPEGFVCTSREDVVARANDLLETDGAAVVKSDFGSGGFGVILLEDSVQPQLAAEIGRRMDRRPSAFRSGPYVVERRVRAEKGLIQGATSVLTLIGPDGTVRIAGWAVEIRDDSNRHVGAHLGRGIPHESLRETLFDQALAVSKEAVALGYQGYLGIDFLIDPSGDVFAIEANPRRCCSESATYDIGRALYGANWDEHKSALLRLPMPVERARRPALAGVLTAFEAANRESEPDACVVPLSLAWLNHGRPGIAYIVFAPSVAATEETERALHERLRRCGVNPVP